MDHSARNPCRVLITGCSGGGKSTLLEALAAKGYACVPEPGRRVIARERARGGDGLPWVNMERFARLCLDMAIADWRAAGPGITFFDRGILDASLALICAGQAEDAHLRHPYDRIVLAPPWPEIFTGDADRQHSEAAARAEYDHIAAHAPDALILPKLPVADRMAWLLSNVIDP